MISRALTKATGFRLARAFSTRAGALYTWGERTVNLGHNLRESSPVPIDLDNVCQVSMGQNHTLALTTTGDVFAFGDGAIGTGRTGFTESPTKLDSFEKNGLIVTSIACGKTFSAALASNGQVYTWGSGSAWMPWHMLFAYPKNGLGQGNNTTVAHPTVLSGLAGKTVTQISAGDYFGVATTSNNEVYVWGAGAAFCNPKLEYSATPVELTVVTDYLRDGGYTIKSVKASGDSVMILTKCGHLFGWGGNYFGQIANGHDKLHIRDREVYRPTEVVKNYTGTIRNFDLSEDLCVMYTDANKAYYCGRYLDFKWVEVTAPHEATITGVGATKSGFALTTAEGYVFTFGECYQTDKKYFDQNLSLVGTELFNGRNVVAVGGHYENKYALAL